MPEETLPTGGDLRLTALSVADAVRVLNRSGSRCMTEERLRADLALGAPCNPDGTLNLIHYLAWLAREVAHAA